MSRTRLIFILLIGMLAACNPVGPMLPIVYEAPPIPAAVSDLKLTILDDNTIADETLQTDWGFAVLIEYGDHTLLFDTGTGLGSALQDNLQKLGIAPESIEAIVLSHQHDDHVGGLRNLLEMGIQPTVYVPSTFMNNVKDYVRARTTLVEVTDPLEIVPGIFATGPVAFLEQGLVIEAAGGTVIVLGCAHPGLIEMVAKAQEAVPGKVVLLAGGFHLSGYGEDVVLPMIAELRQLGVEGIMPAHCTGEPATTLFRTGFGENFHEAGVGRSVTFSAD